MKQTLHIFRKDIRHFWPYIAVVLALTAAMVYTAHWNPGYLFRSGSAGGGTQGILQLPLLVAWWFLVAAVIHDEALAGNRQFWVTRPYSWKSLLAAKALFVIAFVHIPFLVSDCWIFSIYGFSPASMVPDLLWRQLLLPFSLVLPAAVLAALTRRQREFVTVGFVLLVVSLLGTMAFYFGGPLAHMPFWGALAWIREFASGAIFLVLLIPVLLWQYARRRTVAACIVAVAGAVLSAALLFLPRGAAAFAIGSRFQPDSAECSKIAIDFAPGQASPRTPGWEPTPRERRILIPIRIGGVDPNLVQVDARRVTITPVHGGSQTYDFGGVGLTWWVDSLEFHLLESVIQRLRAVPVNVRAQFDLSIYRSAGSARVEPSGRPFPVPGFGFVRLRDGQSGPLLTWWSPRGYGPDIFVCTDRYADEPLGRKWAAEYWSERISTIFQISMFREPQHAFSSYGHGDWVTASFIPVSTFVRPLDRMPMEVDFTAARPVAYIRRELVIPNLNLADYVVP
jgi:hypothetical protein